MVLFDHTDYPIYKAGTIVGSPYTETYPVEPFTCINLGSVTTSFQTTGMLGQIRASLWGYSNADNERLLVQDVDIRLNGNGCTGMLHTIINRFAHEVRQVDCVKRSHYVKISGHIRLRVRYGPTVVVLDYNTRTDVLILHHEQCNRAAIMSHSGLVRADSYLPRYDCSDELRMLLVNSCSSYISSAVDRSVVKINPGEKFNRDARGALFIESDGLICNPHYLTMCLTDVLTSAFCEDQTVWINHPVGNEDDSSKITKATAQWLALSINHYETRNVENTISGEEDETIQHFVEDLRSNVPQYDTSGTFAQFLLGPGSDMEDEDLLIELCLNFIDQTWHDLNGGLEKNFQIFGSDVDGGSLPLGEIIDAIILNLPDEEE